MIAAAKLIARHLPNVLTYFTHRVTNAVAEGLNSKIATVQKRACGYRNPNNFKIVVCFHRTNSIDSAYSAKWDSASRA